MGLTPHTAIKIAINSASVAGKETSDLSLDDQIMGHIAKIIIQSLLDFGLLG